ncbi:GDSL esterase/lipase LTL1 isoform X6 [Aegilops tauschii subsp. strangulata]|nr:GDSL esterase/lipase LTL1 isoform X1 [Aegilops tauschii subsp. strangulata]
MRGENLLVSANFASTGVGILNDTGVQFVNIIRIVQQLQNFQDYQQRLAAYVGEDAARERVSQSLVLITLGGNDFVNNYYLVPFSARSQQFKIHDYVHFIISEYKKVLAGDMDEGKEASSAGLNNSGRYWIGLCRNYGKGPLRCVEERCYFHLVLSVLSWDCKNLRISPHHFSFVSSMANPVSKQKT